MTKKNIERYTFNFFAFPQGYFEEHTAEELGVSEDDHQELIRLHIPSSKERRKAQEELQAAFIKEFLELSEENIKQKAIKSKRHRR